MSRIRSAVFFCLVLSFAFSIHAQGAPTLRISLSPVFASLPVAFAEEWGLFDEEGIDVEIIGLADTQVRSAALATGDIDFVVEDVSQFILDLQSGIELLATSAAYVTPQSGSTTLGLISPGSFRLESIDDLVAREYLVGTMYRSDHEFMLDQLFDAVLEDDQERPRYSFMTDILFLATWFGAQALPAVVLPEPHLTYIATYTPVDGSSLDVVVLSDFSEVESLPSLFVFRGDFADENPDAVDAFYAAYRAAVDRVNETPREELIETGLDVVLPLFFTGADPSLIGEDVLDALPIPTFEQPKDLPEEQFQQVLAWMEDRGYAFLRPTYEDVFRTCELP